MKLVIVKIESCGQKIIASLPDKECLYVGDKVAIKYNKKGKETLATCLCDSYFVDEKSDVFKAVISAKGASEPLTNVVGRYYEYRFETDKGEPNEDKE